jgi:vitamin B12 transporter
MQKWIAFYFFLALFITAGQRIFAQSDSIRLLPSVTVHSLPIRLHPPGAHVMHLSEPTLALLSAHSVADVLSRQGGVYIKSYGLGSLATSAIRGGSAAHTAVLWNGFPIQNPMLGLNDLALIPLFFMDDIRLQYGGSGANWGNGSVGGALVLEQKPDTTNAWQLGAQSSMGSFATQKHQAGLRLGFGQLKSSTRLFVSSAKNDFPYRIQDGLPERRQTNAAQQAHGLMQDLYWQPNPLQQLAFHLWWQENNRQIPPTTTQTKSLAQQQDQLLRTSIHWRKLSGRHTFQMKAAYLQEEIDFRDEQIALKALTGFRTLAGEMEMWLDLRHGLSLLTGINNSYSTGMAQAYVGTPSTLRGAIFTQLALHQPNLEATLQLRQEWADGAFIPLQPALGIDGHLTSWLSIQARLARHFRLPTLNDLYWQPGGNPDLRPETGWSQEAGFKLRVASWLSAQVTGYHRLIDDWILWSAPEGQILWAPNNITRVRSRGIETRLTGQGQWQQLKIESTLGYDLTRSTNEVPLTRPNLAAGQQLYYTPVNQAFGEIKFFWSGWLCAYAHRYTGEVEGLNEKLDGFSIGWLSLSRTLFIKKQEARIFVDIDNLMDNQYRVIERRPMPGRSIQAGISIKLHKL